MTFHVLTLFPDMVRQILGVSILGRAQESGIISLDVINIRDFSEDRHFRVDDYPYGGGAGMVIQAPPVYRAYESAAEKIGRRPRVVYLTPQGPVLTQEKARELAAEEDLILLCGHYEGIDDRVLEEIVTDNLSIGDYVLTGGELPAMVLIDAVSRMVPGVLTNEQSGEDESFMSGLLEYPQYTRPEVFHGKPVPEILKSGHHAKIDAWRREQSLKRTLERRPELLETAELSKTDRKTLDRFRIEKTEENIPEK